MYVNKRNKTDNAIMEAFIELYVEKDISHITVSQIAEKANINRSTFYAHFDDVYDLLAQVEGKMFGLIEANVKDLLTYIKEDAIEVFFTGITTLFKENEPYFYVLIKSRGNELKTRFVDLLKEKILGFTPDLTEEESEKLSICITYHWSSLTAVLNEWLCEGKKRSIDEIMPFILEIAQTGVLTLMSERYLQNKARSSS